MAIILALCADASMVGGKLLKFSFDQEMKLVIRKRLLF